MSRKKPDPPPFVRLGDTVRRKPITIYGSGDEKLRNGIVVYVHPKGRYHTVEFEDGLRESFAGILR